MQGRKTTPSSFILLERRAQVMPQGKLCALDSAAAWLPLFSLLWSYMCIVSRCD